jgi:hypothetical protein
LIRQAPPRLFTASADPKQEPDGEGRAQADQRLARHIIAGDAGQIADLTLESLDLIGAFFLRVPGQIPQLSTGLGGVGGGGAGQITGGINRGLLELCNILPGGGKRRNSGIVWHRYLICGTPYAISTGNRLYTRDDLAAQVVAL